VNDAKQEAGENCTERSFITSSPNVTAVTQSTMRWAECVAHKRGIRNAYEILVAKPEGKRLPGRPRSRSKDNIKMYLKRNRM
jgi:hypothetical protein